MSRKSAPRWWTIGSAPAARTAGGTGVGPGVKRYRFSTRGAYRRGKTTPGERSPLLRGGARVAAARRAAPTRAPLRLGGRARLVRRGRRGDGVGLGTRMGSIRLPRVLPRRGLA